MCHTYLMRTGPVCRQAGPVPALFNYEATLFWHVQNVSRHRLAEISRTSLEKTLLDGSTCRSNTCIHLPALMVPSQMCKLPMMPRALACPRTITDTGSELCADRDLDGPSPLCPAGHDIQDFKEQSEMWTQNVCKYLQKKKHQISFSFLSLWCFQLIHWTFVSLVSAHYTLMKTISWILYYTHSTFKFLWTLNVLNLFTIYGIKLV